MTPTWVIVRLARGGEVWVFLKDFGFSVRPQNGPKQRREREVCVYRHLLGDAGLGIARYYGSVMDEAEGLGQMHAYFARHVNRLRGRDFLIHQADFFWSKAEHALTAVAQIAPHLVGRLENLVHRYAPIVAVMTGQPPTLVRGGCRPSNILICVASDPSRVCILDWEEVRFGAPYEEMNTRWIASACT
jgi:hypothetical protein